MVHGAWCMVHGAWCDLAGRAVAAHIHYIHTYIYMTHDGGQALPASDGHHPPTSGRRTGMAMLTTAKATLTKSMTSNATRCSGLSASAKP